ncbi:hypothetical protein QOT17_019925 [Balamuthia mandrillaris]
MTSSKSLMPALLQASTFPLENASLDILECDSLVILYQEMNTYSTFKHIISSPAILSTVIKLVEKQPSGHWTPTYPSLNLHVRVMLQIIYPSIYKKVPPSALKPDEPRTPFEDKHFKVKKVLNYDGPPSDCYFS